MSAKSLFQKITGARNLFTSETQLPSASKRKRRQLIIGLDFGTAFTKVVIGESREAYAVHFSKHGSDENPYLLPGVMYASSTGECQLKPTSPKDNIITDMKMRLLRGKPSIDDSAKCVAYIAIVLRYVRNWLLKHHKDTYAGCWIDWNLNVGLPTENYHDFALVHAYKDIAHASWALSVIDAPITLPRAKEMLSANLDTSGYEDRLIHPDLIGLFPEFVAQVTGYVRSPQRQEGLHTLMDVGAGTVDVTVFNVFENDGDELFPIFAKSVKNFGVYFHVLHRLNELGWTGQWRPHAHDAALTDREFAKKVRTNLNTLSEIDKVFRSGVSKQLNDALRHTKQCRYPGSPAWNTGVPIFLCGGGANAEIYDSLIKQQEENGRPFMITRRHLPRPDRLNASRLKREHFDRLSVAYGLSFDAFDIGEIVKESDVEDISEERRESRRAEQTDNWRPCPRCRGNSASLGTNCSTCGGSGWAH